MSGRAASPAGPRRTLALRCLHPSLRWNRAAVGRALRLLDRHGAELAAGEPPGPGELSVAFLEEAELARIHAEFLGDPSPTDVITFPGQPALGLAGEICLSADAARRRAPRGDPSAEITLYLVHGWLHLAGHDDRAPRPRRAMRRAEARAMRLLRSHGAVPPFSFRRPGPAG